MHQIVLLVSLCLFEVASATVVYSRLGLGLGLGYGYGYPINSYSYGYGYPYYNSYGRYPYGTYYWGK